MSSENEAMLNFTHTSPISEIRFNAEGAFVGTLVSDLPPHPKNEADRRSLILADFLAAPLLAKDPGYSEVKFSGTREPGNNKDVLGGVVDAFAHHVIVDSHHTIMLCDLQGMHCSFHVTGLDTEKYPGIIKPKGELCLFNPHAHMCVDFNGHYSKQSTEM